MERRSELSDFISWLIEYAEKPLDRELVRQAEKRDLSVKTLVSLGHGAALTAVTGKVKEILQKRGLEPSPSPIDLPNAIAAAIAEEQARCAAIAQAKADEAHDSHTSNTVYDRAWRQSALKIKTAIERGE